jgi:beta-glucosidase/6-phospho-beta-glucosidase/beta-galactosidase
VATAAYQVQGAPRQGKSPSIWDVSSHRPAGAIRGGGGGDAADDLSHRFSDNVALVKALGVKMLGYAAGPGRLSGPLPPHLWL